MEEISTANLQSILLKTPNQPLSQYKAQYLTGLAPMEFHQYFCAALQKMGLSRSQVIQNSGIEVHYAYQILSGRKRPGRDKVLALCIGAGFSIQQTNRALARAKEGMLYPKRLQDAVIMLALNQKQLAVWKVNEQLERLHLPLLS